MEWLFSWEVTSWAVGILIAVAFGCWRWMISNWQSYFFVFAAADGIGGIAMWGAHTQTSPWLRTAMVFVSVGTIGVLTAQSLRYIDRKRERREHQPIINVPEPTSHPHADDSSKTEPHRRPKTSPGKNAATSTSNSPTATLWNLAARCEGLGAGIIHYVVDRNQKMPTAVTAANQQEYWGWYRVNDGLFHAYFYNDVKALQKDLTVVNIGIRLDE